MNQHSDIDRVLSRWFEEGPNAMPDRVVGVVAGRIGSQPQRRAWRLQGRTTVNQLKLAAALAAAVFIAVVGYNLLPRQGSIVGGPPTPSPTALGATPTRSEPSALPDGSVAPGTYRLSPLASSPSLRIDATVPAGWQGFDSWAILGPNGTGAPSGVGIGFIAADGIFSDPCHWDLTGKGTWPDRGDIATGPTVDGLVNALVANSSYVSTAPVAATLGAYSGKRVDLQLPADIGSCDKGPDSSDPHFFVFGGRDGGLWAQGPGYQMRLWIVQSGTTRLIASVGGFAGTATSDWAAAQGILDSLVITP
jgi:hypothetical protein